MNIVISIITIIVILGFVSSNWYKWSIKNVEYKRYLNKDRVYEEEYIELTTEIVNRKLLPLPWIEVYTEVPDSIIFKDQKSKTINYLNKKEYSIITSLFSYQRVKKKDTFFCLKRGYYNFNDDITITIGDYFGLSNGILILKKPNELIVYPKVDSLESLIISFTKPQGDISVKRWIMPDPMQIIGVREYTNSDSFNTIDWKSTAKLNRLHVRKLGFTSEQSVMVFLNVQTNKIHWMENNIDHIEKGIKIAASIASKAIKESVPIGFSSNASSRSNNYNDFIFPGSNQKQLSLILESLAKISYYGHISIERLIKSKINILGKRSTLVIITAIICNEFIKEINYLIYIGHSIKIILLDNEVDISKLNKKIEIMYSTSENDLSMNKGGLGND